MVRLAAPLTLGGLLLTLPSAASACDPAPNYTVEITQDQTPECVVIDDAFDYDVGALNVSNQCEEPLSLEADSCEACGEALDLEPGEQGQFVLEDRNQPGNTEQSVTWSLGDTTGTVLTRVRYQDNSGACEGWGESEGEGDGDEAARGCRLGAPAESAPWLLGLGLLLVWRRRSSSAA